MELVSAFSGLSLHARDRPAISLQHRSLQAAGPRPGSLVIEAAHKKGGGSTKNGRDSNAQRRGVKVFGGQPVKAGGIILRQTGSTYHAGTGAALGKDYTVYAQHAGIVVFKKNKYLKSITVVPRKEYVIPEGCRRKEGESRRTRKYAKYTPRAQLRAAAAAEAVAGAA